MGKNSDNIRRANWERKQSAIIEMMDNETWMTGQEAMDPWYIQQRNEEEQLRLRKEKKDKFMTTHSDIIDKITVLGREISDHKYPGFNDDRMFVGAMYLKLTNNLQLPSKEDFIRMNKINNYITRIKNIKVYGTKR